MKIRRRRATRGYSLLEILLAISIMAMLASAVVVSVVNAAAKAKKTATETNAHTLRHMAQQWMSTEGDGSCPTTEVLSRAGLIDEASKTTDAWGSAFKITCDVARVTVRSFGPDRRENTADDIVAPPPPSPVATE